MTTFAEGLTSGLRSAACVLVGGNPQWLGQILDWGTPSGLVPTARAIRRWVCGDDDVDPLPPPFEGGQCPVGYFVEFVNSGPGPGTSSTFATGPLGGVVRTGPDEGGAFRWLLLGGEGSTAQFRATVDPGEQWSVSSVSRLDNQPDDCGDPEPDYPPPGPVEVDIDITYGDNNEFTLTVPVIFAPIYVALDGSLNVPVTVNIEPNFEITGNLELFPDFEFSPSIDFGGGEGDGQPDPAPEPDDPGGPGQGEDGEDDEETEVDRRVFFVLIRGLVTDDARPSGIFQPIGPDIYAPRLGSVRFGTAISGVVFWSEDIDIKGLDSFIRCPIPWGATHVTVNPAPGVGVNWVPIFTEPDEWPLTIELGEQRTVDNR